MDRLARSTLVMSAFRKRIETTGRWASHRLFPLAASASSAGEHFLDSGAIWQNAI